MAYTVEEAAELLSLSRAQIYRLIDLGEIETVKIGKSRRLTSRQLDAFLSAQEQRMGCVPDFTTLLSRPAARKKQHGKQTA